MPSDPSPDTQRDFLTVASDLDMITEDVARELADESSSREVAPAQLVLQRGLLTAVQVDIIDTLMRPTDVIPGYEVLSALGHGGMGVVYRARQANLDRVVALKTVLVSQMTDPSAAARFEQEAMAVARLMHPNIVGAYDFGQHEGRLFFAMEYVEGTDLDHLIEEGGQLDESLAWGLARQAAAGLAHAATAGIVHRDIKPANLLLVDAPEGFPLPKGMPMVKIADFGLAFLSNEVETRTRLTSADTALGSPHYMAPEQLGSERVDFHTDIYSLGATVYHMIAGQPPFHGLTLTQAVTQKLAGAPPSVQDDRPDVTPESESLLRAMMQRDRNDRPEDYAELIQRIDDITGGAALLGTGEIRAANVTSLSREPTRAPNEPAPTITLARGEDTVEVEEPGSSLEQPPKKRTRWLALLGIVAAAAIIAVVTLALLPDNDQPAPTGPIGPTRDYLAVGNSELLYDSKSTRGWIAQSGGWDQDKRQIHCDGDGVYLRTIPDYKHYRITAIVTLGSADVAELHFGAQKQPGPPRLVCRMSPDGVVLGKRSRDDGPFEPIGELTEVKDIVDKEHDIIIERQPKDWLVFYDEQLIGWTPVEDGEHLPELRLAVEGGEAWFGEMDIYELVPSDGE